MAWYDIFRGPPTIYDQELRDRRRERQERLSAVDKMLESFSDNRVPGFERAYRRGMSGETTPMGTPVPAPDLMDGELSPHLRPDVPGGGPLRAMMEAMAVEDRGAVGAMAPILLQSVMGGPATEKKSEFQERWEAANQNPELYGRLFGRAPTEEEYLFRRADQGNPIAEAILEKRGEWEPQELSRAGKLMKERDAASGEDRKTYTSILRQMINPRKSLTPQDLLDAQRLKSMQQSDAIAAEQYADGVSKTIGTLENNSRLVEEMLAMDEVGKRVYGLVGATEAEIKAHMDSLRGNPNSRQMLNLIEMFRTEQVLATKDRFDDPRINQFELEMLQRAQAVITDPRSSWDNVKKALLRYWKDQETLRSMIMSRATKIPGIKPEDVSVRAYRKKYELVNQ